MIFNLNVNCSLIFLFHWADHDNWNIALEAKFKVAVLGGGPSGANAADALAKNPNIEVVLFERKLDNAKPCGGAIPYCMIEVFNLPLEIIDRKVESYEYVYYLNYCYYKYFKFHIKYVFL